MKMVSELYRIITSVLIFLSIIIISVIDTHQDSFGKKQHVISIVKKNKQNQISSISPEKIKDALHLKNQTSGKMVIIDSGCSNLSILSQHIAMFKDFTNQSSSMIDELGHGTAITDIAIRLIPDVQLIELKVFNQEDDLIPRNLLNALDWIKDNCKSENIKVVNISSAIPENNTILEAQFQKVINQIRNQGVIIVASSENFSNEKVMPANNENVIAVGNLTYQNTNSDVYTYGNDIESISPDNNKVIVSGTSFSSIIVSSYFMSESGIKGGKFLSNLPKILK